MPCMLQNPPQSSSYGGTNPYGRLVYRHSDTSIAPGAADTWLYLCHLALVSSTRLCSLPIRRPRWVVKSTSKSAISKSTYNRSSRYVLTTPRSANLILMRFGSDCEALQ